MKALQYESASPKYTHKEKKRKRERKDRSVRISPSTRERLGCCTVLVKVVATLVVYEILKT